MVGTCVISNDSSNRYFWLLGVGSSVMASFAITAGTLLQKLAHNENEMRPEHKRFTSSNGIVLSYRWFTGLFILLVFPIPFEAIALTLAPQSLITPLGCVTLVLNQLLAPPILGERVTSLDWCSTLAIVCGIALCTVFGPHEQEDLTLDILAQCISTSGFLLAEAIAIGIVAISLIIMYVCKTSDSSHRSISCLAYAWVAASFAAQQNIVFKAAGMLLYSGFKNGNSMLRQPIFYVFIGMIMFLGCLQIIFLNMGLEKFDAVMFLPLYTGFLIINGVVLGGIFYQEFACFNSSQVVLFPTGLIIALVGTLLLSQHEDTNVAPGAPEAEKLIFTQQ